MDFFVDDTIKIKKIKEDDPFFDRFRQFIGEKFKIVNRRVFHTNGGGGFLYKIRSSSATLNLVPGDIFLLKRRGKWHKRSTAIDNMFSGGELPYIPRVSQSVWVTTANTQPTTITTRFANTVSNSWTWDDE